MWIKKYVIQRFLAPIITTKMRNFKCSVQRCISGGPKEKPIPNPAN
uniref:Uncharacterized protein n=1 Tax=Arundo donax TaxID=35708 RepID=A0A0A8YA36_ARUDO